MQNEVRLIVWDLDETFWRGTLSEGGITEYPAAHHDLVVTLARRGIMSSICSKNDHDEVRRVLTDKGLWDTFIFPSIDWSPKGPRIRTIIDSVQLRPENVLFIDDNASNRGEAQALVPGLVVADETIIGSLLTDPRCRGKRDQGLERLKDYKLLEEKTAAKSTYRDDVGGFLRASNIRVTIEYELEDKLERIVEIVNRTNQLNFTKKRLAGDPEDVLRSLRADLDGTFGQRAGIVRVSDTYGDYGVVGFWAMEGLWGDLRLVHFAFSCRILGMGVEQWVYHKLGKPRLQVVGTVASTLDFEPDWINASGPEGVAQATAQLPRVGLRGGCELEVLKHFFAFNAARVDDEFIFVRGHQTVWRSHIVTMLPQGEMQSAEARAALGRIGLVPEDFSSEILSESEGPTIRVISNSADALVPLYRHKRHGFLAPVLEFELENIGELPPDHIDDYADRWTIDEAARAALHRLAATLRAEYALVPPGHLDLATSYDRVIERCPDDCLLVFLLQPAEDEGRLNALQAAINAALLRKAARYPNVRCIDTAKYTRSSGDRAGAARLHLDRSAYHAIYREIVAIYDDWRCEAPARPSSKPAEPRETGARRSLIARILGRFRARTSTAALREHRPPRA